MAKISDLKYYAIDGIELPVYPTSEKVINNEVSKTFNSMTGTTIDIPVCRKMKVNWVFEYSDDSAVSKIYQQLKTKMETEKSRFFKINYFDPSGDFYEMTAYWGTPTDFESRSSKNKGHIKVWKWEVHFIEVDGIKYI